jgi:hypothetical protein
MELPANLLERLRKDNASSLMLLETASIPDSTQTIKDLSDRKLLSITTKAVDTLEEVLDYGAPKERLAAAEAILDRSPATKPLLAQADASASLPAEALQILMQGMGKLFAVALDHQHTSIKRAEQVLEPLPAPETKLIPAKRRGRKPNAS